MEVCWNARGDSFKEILDRMLKIRWYYGVLGIFLRKVQLSDDGWIRLMYSNILNIVREKKNQSLQSHSASSPNRRFAPISTNTTRTRS